MAYRFTFISGNDDIATKITSNTKTLGEMTDSLLDAAEDLQSVSDSMPLLGESTAKDPLRNINIGILGGLLLGGRGNQGTRGHVDDRSHHEIVEDFERYGRVDASQVKGDWALTSISKQGIFNDAKGSFSSGLKETSSRVHNIKVPEHEGALADAEQRNKNQLPTVEPTVVPGNPLPLGSSSEVDRFPKPLNPDFWSKNKSLKFDDSDKEFLRQPSELLEKIKKQQQEAVKGEREKSTVEKMLDMDREKLQKTYRDSKELGNLP